MKVSKLVAFLPTGDWAEVESIDDVKVVPVNNVSLEFLSNSHISQRMAGQLAMCESEQEVNSLIELWNS